MYFIALVDWEKLIEEKRRKIKSERKKERKKEIYAIKRTTKSCESRMIEKMKKK